MKDILKKLNSITAKAEKILLSLSILLMMINTTANALGRYIFNQSIYCESPISNLYISSTSALDTVFAPLTFK